MNSKDENFGQIIELIKTNQELLNRALSLLEAKSDTGEWIPVKDAALLLGVTPQSVRDWIRSGEVRGKVVGQRKYLVYKPSAMARAKTY